MGQAIEGQHYLNSFPTLIQLRPYPLLLSANQLAAQGFGAFFRHPAKVIRAIRGIGLFELQQLFRVHFPGTDINSLIASIAVISSIAAFVSISSSK